MDEKESCKDCEHWKETKNLPWGVRIGHCLLFCAGSAADNSCTDFKQKETDEKGLQPL